jgi:hypothetical protein
MSQSIRVAAIGVPLVFVLVSLAISSVAGVNVTPMAGRRKPLGAEPPCPHRTAAPDLPAGGITIFWRLRVIKFTILDCALCYAQRDPSRTIRKLRRRTMKLIKLAALTLALSLAGMTAASAASVSGSTALALAGVVAPLSPLPAAEKKVIAAFFAGNTNANYANKITLTADKIVCRTSNVDITARSCELTFKGNKRTVKGREANEIFATLALAGVPSDGAAGSVFESLSKLSCTLDPKAIKEKAGGGADCSFEPGN